MWQALQSHSLVDGGGPGQLRQASRPPAPTARTRLTHATEPAEVEPPSRSEQLDRCRRRRRCPRQVGCHKVEEQIIAVEHFIHQLPSGASRRRGVGGKEGGGVHKGGASKDSVVSALQW